MSNYDNSKIPTVHVRFDTHNCNFNTLVQFMDIVVEKFRIKGIRGITESNNVETEKYIDFDQDGKIITRERLVIYAEGINIQELPQINGIDFTKTKTNDIVLIYETYGVEAGRTAFIKELTLAIASSGTACNYQHIELLADCVTHMGGLIAVNRHGANKLDTDPFSRASFEKTVEQLLAAAVFSESDHIRSVSSRIMAGRPINGGTGAFDLLLDHEKIKSCLSKIQIKQDISVVKKRTNVADLIKRKNKSGI